MRVFAGGERRGVAKILPRELDVGELALAHAGELAQSRVASPKDVVKEGQAVKVKLLGFDDRGKVRLSMKQVDQATGEDLTKKADAPV